MYALYTWIQCILFTGLLNTTLWLFESVLAHEINFSLIISSFYDYLFSVFILLYHHRHEVVLIPGILTHCRQISLFIYIQTFTFIYSHFIHFFSFILNCCRAYFHYSFKMWHTAERKGLLVRRKTKTEFLSHSPTPRDSHEDEIIFKSI